jgi:hypothetical protein
MIMNVVLADRRHDDPTVCLISPTATDNRLCDLVLGRWIPNHNHDVIEDYAIYRHAPHNRSHDVVCQLLIF